MLDGDASHDGGSICVARTGDQDPDQPNLHINADFTIGAGAAATAFGCQSTQPRVHVNTGGDCPPRAAA